MKKKLMAVFMAAVLGVGLVGCGGSTPTSDTTSESSNDASTDGESTKKKDIKIAYIVKAKTDEFWTSMEKGALAYAEEMGVQVDFQAPEKETDVEKQVQFVENAVVKGYDAIILSAADSKSLIPSIVKANDANIPVILVNDTIDMDALAEANGKVETYVGIDQYEAASLAGTYAAEQITDGKICYLEGISGVASHEERLNGFKDQASAFETVASQTAKCDRNEAFNVMQNVLSANPEVNVVWAINAEMGQGAVQAIEQGGFSGKISVFDFDASSDDVKAIQDGTLVGSVAQFPEIQASSAIQACLDVLDGKTLEEHTKTKAELITIENVEAFVADKG